MFLAIIILLFSLSSCVTDKPEEVWSLQAGDKLPEFSIVLDNGDRISTQTLKGKKSILIFFTTTCEDCRRELPSYQRWYEEIQDSGEEVNFICISREEGPNAVSSYWENNELTMPYSAQSDRIVYNLFASSGVPRVYEANAELIITNVVSN